MAHEIGEVLRQLRMVRGLTQAELYTGVLSARQAIRVENGTSELKARDLIPILARLGLTPNEFQAQLSNNLSFKPLTAPEILAGQAVLRKLNRWVDWALTPAEIAALKHYALAASALSIQEILQMQLASTRLDPVSGAIVRKRLVRDLQVYQDAPGYREAMFSLITNNAYGEAFAGHVVAAKAAFDQAHQYVHDGYAALQLVFNQALLADSPAGVLYQVTEPFVIGVWRLGERHLADGLIDNRRHILMGRKMHPQWLPEEIGALARLNASAPPAALPEAGLDWASFPGLREALDKHSLTDYLQAEPKLG